MIKHILYTKEGANGEIYGYDVTYTISKAYAGVHGEQPPEDAEITILSIQHNGVEIEDIHDSVIDDIEQKIWAESGENDMDFGMGDLD
jgi:hypothetical protein